MTTSAVSQQMAKLEREVGQQLLAKNGRGVRLTDAGRLLAEHAGADPVPGRARPVRPGGAARAPWSASCGWAPSRPRRAGCSRPRSSRLRATTPQLRRALAGDGARTRACRGWCAATSTWRSSSTGTTSRCRCPAGWPRRRCSTTRPTWRCRPAIRSRAATRWISEEFADDEWIAWPRGRVLPRVADVHPALQGRRAAHRPPRRGAHPARAGRRRAGRRRRSRGWAAARSRRGCAPSACGRPCGATSTPSGARTPTAARRSGRRSRRCAGRGRTWRPPRTDVGPGPRRGRRTPSSARRTGAPRSRPVTAATRSPAARPRAALRARSAVPGRHAAALRPRGAAPRPRRRAARAVAVAGTGPDAVPRDLGRYRGARRRGRPPRRRERGDGGGWRSCERRRRGPRTVPRPCRVRPGPGAQARATESPSTVMSAAGSGRVAGPPATLPSLMLNLLPWQGQLIVPPETSPTAQP